MLEELRVDAGEPFAGGRSWGGYGPYEWVRGDATFAVDPASPGNDRITDLGLAPAGADGRVRFDADVRLLRPADGVGNGRLLFVVANRGLLGGVPLSADAPFGFGPSEELDPGDGFLLERGWTVVWGGWQWDVLRNPGQVGLAAPEAEVAPGNMRIEFRLDAPASDHALADSSYIFTFSDLPTADLQDPDAALTVRDSPDGERRVVDRDAWRFPDHHHVALDGGFEPFRWYELVYRTSRCPVAGTGLLAVRDLVSHLRRSGPFDHALAYGVSQSGRFLRQFVHDGLNLDEQGERVFDGVLSHIAGGRRGEFNHRYAQPSLTHVIGFGNAPPYDSAGLHERQRSLGGAPKAFYVNTAWEYWRGDGALGHVDPATGDDLEEDPDTRTFLVAGTDHIGAVPMKDAMPAANPVHHLDLSPVLRALFLRLDAWACDGMQPPASQVPRRADGTAVTRAEVLHQFRSVPGAHLPDEAVLNVTRPVDLGPDAGRGVGRWPLELGDPVVALVSAVDADGNEVAGIRLPAVAAPVAAFTGWNPRRPQAGLPDVLYEFVGSRLPFPPGRPTVEERYGDRDGYAKAARRAVTDLVTAGFLLDIDTERAVAAALRQYDEVAA